METAFLAVFGACAALCVLAAVYVARSQPRALARRYDALHKDTSQAVEQLTKTCADIRHEFNVWEERMEELFDATERKRRRIAGTRSREQPREGVPATREEALQQVRKASGLMP